MLASQISANLIRPYVLPQQLLRVLIEAQGQVVFVNSNQALRAPAGIGQSWRPNTMKAVGDSHEIKSMRMVCAGLFFFGDLQARVSGLSRRQRGVRTRRNG